MPGKGPITPRYEKAKPLRLAGVRKTYVFSERGDIADHWRDFSARIDAIEGRVGVFSYGVAMDPSGAGDFDYMTAVEIEEGAAPEGLERLRIDADMFAVFRHEGPIAILGDTMSAIHRDFLPSARERLVVGILERYAERYDPETGEGGLDIIAPLRN